MRGVKFLVIYHSGARNSCRATMLEVELCLPPLRIYRAAEGMRYACFQYEVSHFVSGL